MMGCAASKRAVPAAAEQAGAAASAAGRPPDASQQHSGSSSSSCSSLSSSSSSSDELDEAPEEEEEEAAAVDAAASASGAEADADGWVTGTVPISRKGTTFHGIRVTVDGVLTCSPASDGGDDTKKIIFPAVLATVGEDEKSVSFFSDQKEKVVEWQGHQIQLVDGQMEQAVFRVRRVEGWVPEARDAEDASASAAVIDHSWAQDAPEASAGVSAPDAVGWVCGTLKPEGEAKTFHGISIRAPYDIQEDHGDLDGSGACVRVYAQLSEVGEDGAVVGEPEDQTFSSDRREPVEWRGHEIQFTNNWRDEAIFRVRRVGGRATKAAARAAPTTTAATSSAAGAAAPDGDTADWISGEVEPEGKAKRFHGITIRVRDSVICMITDDGGCVVVPTELAEIDDDGVVVGEPEETRFSSRDSDAPREWRGHEIVCQTDPDRPTFRVRRKTGSTTKAARA